VKQVHLIARLCAELAERGHRVVWHHFGVGDHVPSMSVIEGLKGITRLEIVMHGWKPNADIMAFYRTHKIDLFVNLSRSEGIPVSIMEAISFDIPVLATAVDGTPEAVIDEQSGLLCSVEEAGDSVALASRVEEAFLIQTRPRYSPRALWERRFNAARNFGYHAADLASIARKEYSG
jgi:glycosyltransferase involved in cell wall biosynthesis